MSADYKGRGSRHLKINWYQQGKKGEEQRHGQACPHVQCWCGSPEQDLAARSPALEYRGTQKVDRHLIWELMISPLLLDP